MWRPDSSRLADPCHSDEQTAQWARLPYVRWVGAAAIRDPREPGGCGEAIWGPGQARRARPPQQALRPGQCSAGQPCLKATGHVASLGLGGAAVLPNTGPGPGQGPPPGESRLLAPEGPDATRSSGTWIAASARSPPAPGPSLAAGVTLSPTATATRSTWRPASARAGPSAWDALLLPPRPRPPPPGLPEGSTQLLFATRCQHCHVTLTFL